MPSQPSKPTTFTSRAPSSGDPQRQRLASASDHPRSPPPSLPSLWRNRDYLLLWGGQALSDIGGAVSLLAYPLLVLALTHSPAQAGFVEALRALPATLFSLLAG